ncbi:sensor histidine kinase [Qipengyuania sphaerica]|uniref:sensor histidine kinase n=1 Tax=Qipengyuania sphaerica TaxID=2867243 RepID=UPI001C885DF9|nr:HWE histidine kinase domain-containing protein [Qipengyuania sphaerica]MBX7539474.1 PAS domain-containing protein [Qipengyuania sphaerica]
MVASKGSNWPEGRAPEARYCGEEERLSVLATYGGQDLVGDPELEDIAGFAAKLCEVPMAMVTVVEAEHQRFLAKTGLDAETTPRPTSFCAHAMLGAEPMVIPDAREDERFEGNALVTGEPHIRFYAGQPLISPEGAPLGALCVIDTKPRAEGLTDLQRQGLAVLAQSVMRRLGQRRLGRHVNLTLEKSERELRRMVDSVPGIAWRADDKGNFTYVNARWKELTGIEPPTTTEEWKVAIHPEDWDGSLAKFLTAVETNSLFEDEWRLRMSDGSYRWVQSRAMPVITEGQPTSWFGTVIDIDKAHRLSEARDLLAGELSHRIKNIFAVVSGLIALRSRNRPEAKEFADDLSSAIRALGTAHDYVRPDDGRGADNLQGLLEDLLAPYEGAKGERVHIKGDDVIIGSRAATPLALIFHELATNAAKYGALGNHDGKVEIEIRQPCGEEDEVCVFWRESSSCEDKREDGEGEGFGSRMLRMAIEGQLGGRFSRAFSDDGLDVEIAFPLASLGH